jgi:hypothetical protein
MRDNNTHCDGKKTNGRETKPAMQIIKKIFKWFNFKKRLEERQKTLFLFIQDRKINTNNEKIP